VNIGVTIISLVVTTLAYRKTLGTKKNNNQEKQSKTKDSESKSQTNPKWKR